MPKVSALQNTSLALWSISALLLGSPTHRCCWSLRIPQGSTSPRPSVALFHGQPGRAGVLIGRVLGSATEAVSSSDVVKYDASQSSTSSENKERSTSSSYPVTVSGPSMESKPDYDKIFGPLGKQVDRIFLSVFRTRMAEKVGVDSTLPKDDFSGLIELTAALNARYSDRLQVQRIAQDVLRSLFPSWLPGQFAVLFSKPFPKFSSRLNAWATAVAGTWLMGELEINDCDTDGGDIGEKQGVLVKRCRFLEEAGCASVCINSCKLPTQRFFAEDMGLSLTMTPNYETFECQFSFGLTPSEAEEKEAKMTPCLSRCPSNGGMRKWHDGSAAAGQAVESIMCSQMDS